MKPYLTAFYANGKAYTFERSKGGGWVEELCGSWQTVLQLLNQRNDLETNFDFGIGSAELSITTAITAAEVRTLWLNICRDEELITKAGAVVSSYNPLELGMIIPISLSNAIVELGSALRYRGRQF